MKAHPEILWRTAHSFPVALKASGDRPHSGEGREMGPTCGQRESRSAGMSAPGLPGTPDPSVSDNESHCQREPSGGGSAVLVFQGEVGRTHRGTGRGVRAELPSARISPSVSLVARTTRT